MRSHVMFHSGRSRVLPSVLLLTILALGGTTAADAQDPAVVGQWGPLLQWPAVSVHTHLLPTGQVLFWAYDDAQGFYLWDPATESVTSAATPELNLFCSGHSFLADGRLIATGGHIRNNVGLQTASIYDPGLDTWTRIPDMNEGRWYPSTTTLANGDVLVTSGDKRRKVNELPQVYQVAQNAWRDLSDATFALPLYPRTFLAPNGFVFVATATSRYLDTSGTGNWTDVASRIIAGRDNYGSAVLYDDGKVLWTGGGDPPTETAEVIDLNVPNPAWTLTGSMAQPRRQNNVTLLPDGTVLATGGSSARGFNDETGAVLSAELWDPATGAWTILASEERYRGYHSTALLLPDGRVLSSGGDGQPNAQIFSPPYLFKGARPVIDSAPASVELGGTFFVASADAASVTAVNLLRLGSLTHAQNWSQRISRLSFTQAAGGLQVDAPSDANLAPPGYYLLFLLNGSGVPSVASMLRLDFVALPCTVASVSVSSITLSTFGIGSGQKRGRARVAVADNCGNPIAGALVQGTFSRDISEPVSGTTDAAGVAILETVGTTKGNVKIDFCVDDVIDAVLPYDPAGNVETCDRNY